MAACPRHVRFSQIVARNPYTRQVAWIVASQDSVNILQRTMRRLGNAHFIGDLTMPARANPSCGPTKSLIGVNDS
jgi:hypothetical protein